MCPLFLHFHPGMEETKQRKMRYVIERASSEGTRLAGGILKARRCE